VPAARGQINRKAHLAAASEDWSHSPYRRQPVSTQTRHHKQHHSPFPLLVLGSLVPLDLLVAIVAAVVAVMILVTGATGHIGSELARLLADQGAPARALIHSPDKAAPIQRLGLETALGDYDSPTPWMWR
jgi:hypothetical protein